MSKKITITIEEASEMTGASIRSIRQWIKAGKIRATKPGKHLLIFCDSLYEYLKKCEQVA